MHSPTFSTSKRASPPQERPSSSAVRILEPAQTIRRGARRVAPKARSNRLLFLIPLVLCGAGLLALTSISIARMLTSSETLTPLQAFRPVLVQSLWVVLGLGVMTGVSRMPSTFWRSTAGLWVVLGSGILMALLLVPGFGTRINYATRWIQLPAPLLGTITLQPSEAFKLATLIWFASLYARRPHARWVPLDWGITALWLIGVLAVERQPDFGTAGFIFALGVAVAFLGGASLLKLASLCAFGAMLAVLVVVKPLIVSALSGQPLDTQKHAYRIQRLLAFSDPWRYQDDIGYQMVRAQLAVGSGGIARFAIGEGREKRFLPAAENDYIFATIAEETGFVGCMVVIGLFTVLVSTLFRLAREPTMTPFGRLFLGGLALWIALSAGINIGMAIGLLPTVGLPLPFVSAGGSALLSLMTALGIAQACVRENLCGSR